MKIAIKRIYDDPSPADGYRVLVDRLWPRGLKKADTEIDEWARDLAPSADLRKWFGHDPDRWEEFRRRYTGELLGKADELAALVERGGAKRLTLLFAARDSMHNNAVVLKDIIKGRKLE